MPTHDGKLTAPEKERALTWIKDRWQGEARCPVCGSSEWTMPDQIVNPMNYYSGGGIRIGGGVFPQVMLLSPCGYTMYFNLIRMHILDSDGKTASPSPAQAKP